MASQVLETQDLYKTRVLETRFVLAELERLCHIDLKS